MSVEFKLPELGENIESGDVVSLLVSEGDVIEGNQGVIELETDKAVVEIPCPHAGKITKLLIKKGDTVNVGQAILEIVPEDTGAATPEALSEKPASAPPTEASARAAPAKPAPEPAAPKTPETVVADTTPEGSPLPAGPAARRVAREMGVDLRGVQGSGDRGRITVDDVRATAGRPGTAAVAAEAAAATLEPVVPPGEEGHDDWGPIRRDRMSKIRKTIAAQMSRSASTIPHVTNFDDADVTELEAIRKGVPKGYLGANLKLTAMPFVMKSVALALRRHPLLNATLDEENEQVVYKQYVHLGIAVDTPRGLVVPKVRNADRMSIPELARALASLAERARAVQFSIDELRGGTFTISNLGAVGGAYSTPIINHPEVAILLLGRSRWMPMVREGNVEPRFMMPLSLSYDHRLVDGATAGRFLNDVIDLLQSPGKLLLAE